MKLCVFGFRILGAAVLSILLLPQTTPAAPDGKTWTGEIGGAVALVLFGTYESALLREKGSVLQGDITMDAPIAMNDDNNPDAALSLRKVRGILLVDVANANPGKWRDEFENFRACWNTTLSAPPDASPSDSPKRKADAGTAKPDEQKKLATARPTPRVNKKKPSPSPSPTPTPQPPGCGALLENVLDAVKLTIEDPKTTDHALKTLNKHIDVRDLSGSFANSPSLFAEVLSQNVGSFAAHNYLRAQFLVFAASRLSMAMAAQQSTEGVVDDLSTFAAGVGKNCLGTFSAFDCIAKLSDAEAALAKAQAHRDACEFNKKIWMPSYSEILLWKKKRGPFSHGKFWNLADWPQQDAVPQGPPSNVAALSTATYATLSNTGAIDGLDYTVLGIPPGC